MKIIALAVLFSFASFAEEVKDESWRPQNYAIDWKYHAGEFLVYDCERAHYACVDKDGNENCREERKFAIEKKLPQFPCAPLKKFSTKQECVLENYKIQDIGAQKRFCYPKN